MSANPPFYSFWSFHLLLWISIHFMLKSGAFPICDHLRNLRQVFIFQSRSMSRCSDSPMGVPLPPVSSHCVPRCPTLSRAERSGRGSQLLNAETRPQPGQNHYLAQSYPKLVERASGCGLQTKYETYFNYNISSRQGKSCGSLSGFVPALPLFGFIFPQRNSAKTNPEWFLAKFFQIKLVDFKFGAGRLAKCWKAEGKRRSRADANH